MSKLAVARRSLLAAMPATVLAHGQEKPSDPYESPGVCPFECRTQVRNKAGRTGWARDGRFRDIDACG